jgi:undecaprenyl-diphosphatase
VSLLEAIVLGFAQGATELLPISSTGHLRVIPAFFGWEDPGAAFTAVTQLGTMASILVFFFSDLKKVAITWTKSLFNKELRSELDARMGWYLIVATIPISIFGLAFSDQIETGARNLYLVGAMLIVFGLILGLADRVGKRSRPMTSVGIKDAIAVGSAQAIALIPGASRSGVTLTAGLFMGLDRTSAARFSFLLSVPAVVLSGLYQLPDAAKGDSSDIVALVVATITAFIVGYLVIGWLLRFLTSHSVTIFVVYRVILGTAVIALAGAGLIS